MATSRACMCFCRTFSKVNSCSTPIVRLGFNSRCFSSIPYTRSKLFSFPTSLVWIHKKNFSVVSGVLFKPKDTANDSISANKILQEKLAGSSSQNDKESGKKSEEEKKKNEEFSRRMMKYSFLAFGSIFTGVACLLVYEWGSPPKDSLGNLIEDEYSKMPIWKAYIMRTYKEMLYYDKMIKEPSREKLLPDPLTEPYYQPPYTLVLEMTGVLVQPDWTYQTGWRFKKRPGIDFFLQQVGPPLYEIVIYTSEQGFTAYPILDTLDPHGFIMYRLFRDATRYTDGTHVKDLSCLNRDLSKIIYVDWNEKAFQLNPENAFKMKRWMGNDDDRALIDLAVFLRTIATSSVEDVRTVLEFYKQFDDPLEAFRENHRKVLKEQGRPFFGIFPYRRFRQTKAPKTGGPKLIPTYRPNKNRSRGSWKKRKRKSH